MITLKQYLLEESAHTLVFAFGRYSPPTRGHIQHFQTIKQYAEQQNYPYMIYVSNTIDNKKNPVPVIAKIAYIKKAIPNIRIAPAQNMFQIVDAVAQKGQYDKLIYFAGGDYFTDATEKQLFDRLQKFATSKGITLEVKSTGERTEGISGTALRNAVRINDFETFLKASPVDIGRLTQDDAYHMFELTRQGLKL